MKDGKGLKEDRVCIYNSKVGAHMAEVAGRERLLEEKRLWDCGDQGQISVWIFEIPFSHQNLNFKIVYDSVSPVSYTHLTLPTTGSLCRSRWSPYH